MVLLFSSFVFATNDTTANVRDVTLRYCNGTGAVTKTLFLQTKPTKKEELCLEFSNEWWKDAPIGLSFVDGTLTADTDQKKACLPEWTKDQFGQYVTWFEQRFIVPARGKKRISASLEFPEGYAGTSYGCATYFLADDPGQTIKNEGQMFTIFARVGSFIDAFVDGKITPQLIMLPVQWDLFVDEGTNPNFVIYREGLRKYRVRWNIYNTWNIAVSGGVAVKRSSWWWIVWSSITYADQQVLPRQSTLVDMELPWYAVWFWGSKVTVDLQVQYKPIYLWAHNTQDITKTYTLESENSKMFFPWVIVVILVLALATRLILKKVTQYRLTRTTTKPKRKPSRQSKK